MVRYIYFCLFVCLFVCSCEKKTAYSIVIKNKKIALNDTITLNIKNLEGNPLDSVTYIFQGKRITNENGNVKLFLKDFQLGKHDIKALVYSEENLDTIFKKVVVLNDIPPQLYTYEIINTYPHDIEAYTQGLEFYKGYLYESTGLKGQSSLRKIDYKTGAVIEQLDLHKPYFGEGLTILNDTIYQLTWKSKLGFVYNMDFDKIKTFAYNQSKEGWGICNDGKYLYKSDGSELIWILNRETLVEEKSIQICSDKSVFSKANELEWSDGKIYANTYLKDGIMIINPKNGAILGVVDCRGLKEKVKQHNQLDVLNGIAYNPQTGTFFVTGKNWNKLFEVRFLEK